MGGFARTGRAGSGRSRLEGPTWLALAICYTLWIATIWHADLLGYWFVIPAAIATAFHSSLQHEILHGHPTRNALVNEALVFPAPGMFIPYRRFRDLHLKHHNDDRLTDPYDDPESFYLPAAAWGGHCAIMRAVMWANATFAGRMLLGPALMIWGFWRSEIRLMQDGDRAVQGAWLRHALGIVPVVAILMAAGVPLWLYVIGVAYPAVSLIMVRSYVEHRAADHTPERTAIVEAGLFWRLLFLNNNFHAVHHDRPALAWYRIPERWRTERTAVIDRNGGYILPGYGAVAWKWLLRPREPVVHPLSHHVEAAGTPAE